MLLRTYAVFFTRVGDHVVSTILAACRDRGRLGRIGPSATQTSKVLGLDHARKAFHRAPWRSYCPIY
jgi:hypothetical protein